MQVTITEDELASIESALQLIGFVGSIGADWDNDHKIDMKAGDLRAFLNTTANVLRGVTNAASARLERRQFVDAAEGINHAQLAWLFRNLRHGYAALRDEAAVARLREGLEGAASHNADAASALADLDAAVDYKNEKDAESAEVVRDAMIRQAAQSMGHAATGGKSAKALRQ